MTITINATGAERKRLVQTISKWLGCDAKDLGVPSGAYRVDYFTIDLYKRQPKPWWCSISSQRAPLTTAS